MGGLLHGGLLIRHLSSNVEEPAFLFVESLAFAAALPKRPALMAYDDRAKCLQIGIHYKRAYALSSFALTYVALSKSCEGELAVRMSLLGCPSLRGSCRGPGRRRGRRTWDYFTGP